MTVCRNRFARLTAMLLAVILLFSAAIPAASAAKTSKRYTGSAEMQFTLDGNTYKGKFAYDPEQLLGSLFLALCQGKQTIAQATISVDGSVVAVDSNFLGGAYGTDLSKLTETLPVSVFAPTAFTDHSLEPGTYRAIMDALNGADDALVTRLGNALSKYSRLVEKAIDDNAVIRNGEELMAVGSQGIRTRTRVVILDAAALKQVCHTVLEAIRKDTDLRDLVAELLSASASQLGSVIPALASLKGEVLAKELWKQIPSFLKQLDSDLKKSGRKITIATNTSKSTGSLVRLSILSETKQDDYGITLVLGESMATTEVISLQVEQNGQTQFSALYKVRENSKTDYASRLEIRGTGVDRIRADFQWNRKSAAYTLDYTRIKSTGEEKSTFTGRIRTTSGTTTVTLDTPNDLNIEKFSLIIRQKDVFTMPAFTDIMTMKETTADRFFSTVPARAAAVWEDVAAVYRKPVVPGTPVITKHPTSETIYAGGYAEFVARADYADEIIWHITGPYNRYQILASEASRRFPGLLVTGIGTERLGLSQVPKSMDGCTVWAEFIGREGSSWTTSARLTVAEQVLTAPVIYQQSGDCYLRTGESTILYVNAYSNDPGCGLTYQWYRTSYNSNTSGTAIRGANSATYIPGSFLGGVYYYCEVRATNGVLTSSPTLSRPILVNYSDPMPVIREDTVSDGWLAEPEPYPSEPVVMPPIAEDTVTDAPPATEPVISTPMTYRQFMDAPDGSAVYVDTYVQTCLRWRGNRMSVYCQGPDGAYFLYRISCTEAEAAQLLPGTRILVSGTKRVIAAPGQSSEEVEINDATVIVADGFYLADAIDMTNMAANGTLAAHRNELGNFYGVTYVAKRFANDNIYLTFECGGVNVEFRLFGELLYDLRDPAYKIAQALQPGDMVNITAYAHWNTNVPNPDILSINLA